MTSKTDPTVLSAEPINTFEWLRSDPATEGIPSAPVHALELDSELWRGYHERVLPRLKHLLEQGPPIEKAAAGWVLARWAMDQQDDELVSHAIRSFHAHAEGLEAVPHPGPFLLAVQSSLRSGDFDSARSFLKTAIGIFGELPDFALARLDIARSTGGTVKELSSILRRLYVETGLAGVSLDDGPAPLFDRLEGAEGSTPAGSAESLPLVSVIVPVFNSAAQLPTALGGLQSQTWPNLELIVVDDGSTDESLTIAHAAAKSDPRIRVLALGENEGAYPARNAGFSEARGKFVTVHDADDWSHPQKIEAQARALVKDTRLKATVSHWVRAGNALEMTRWRIESGWVYRNVSSLMIRSELREHIGYWDRARVNADTEYYYRITHLYGAGAIREVYPGIPLAFARTLPESLTNNSATHMRTQFHGVRHEYMEAAHDWHRRAETPASLCLPRYPAQRPFNISGEISLGDPECPASDYDLLSNSALFDADWYLQAHHDVMQSEMGPVRHYLEVGARENRDPGPLFSTGGYRQANGLQPQDNPLLHYLRRGQEEGRKGLPVFEGKLATEMEDCPAALVFAHTSGETLFGAERSLLDVVSRIAHDGVRPIVVLPALRNPEYLHSLLERSAAVEVVPQFWRNSLRAPYSDTIAAMRALIRKYAPLEVHVNTLMQEAPSLAARAENVPSVMYVREMPAEDPALCRTVGMNAETLRRQLLEQVDRFIMPSRVVADWLDCPDRSTVRPNAVDEALFDLHFSPGRFLNVALISSNIAKKGVGDFIEVARIVARTGRPVRFLVIGPQTNELLRLQPFPSNVQFRDYASSPVEAIKQADIIFSLSHFAESFGRTVVEAMAAGRPVICYDRGAPPTLVVRAESGLVVPPGDVKRAADALLALDVARLQLYKMSLAARRRAREIQNQALA